MLINDKGFTLIELLVVIAVLGILAAIAIPRLTNIRDKAEDTNIDSAVGALRNGLEMHYAETGSYPSMGASDSFMDIAGSVSDYTTIPDVSSYISSTTPTDNSGNQSTFSITVNSANTTKTWTITPGGLSTGTSTS
ncbi:MAG: type II secretion system GspH family protein [Halanaerobiales bacterium]|nr:type II secretion system GspH family protein [Halanaerobiales bacterium]